MARRVPPGSVVADIGTDHGLLPIWLVVQHQVAKVIGVEVSERSMAKARANMLHFNGSVELRVGDGLAPIAPGEAGTLVIAGLGGESISQILSQGVAVAREARTIVAQPMKDATQLARWADESGLGLEFDDIVSDRSWTYRVLTFTTGSSFVPVPWNPEETSARYEITPAMWDNDHVLLARYLARRLRIRRSVHEKASGAAAPASPETDGVLSALEAAIAKLTGEC